MAFNYDIADTPIAQFSLCVRVFLNITQQSGSFVTISSSQRGAIVVDIVISGNRYFIERRANMRTTNGVFRIANALTLEEADLLSFHAVLIIEEECGEDVTPDQVERAEVLETQSTFSVTRPVKCRALSTTQPFQPGSILGLIASLVTLNDAEELLVARVPQNPDLELDSPLKFSSGAHLNLLKRRQPTVSLAVLFIIVTCLVVIRIFVNLVTNNDVDAAIESILKSALGMHMSHSLLSDNSVVRYNHKYQQGDVAHYGVELQGMTEVAQFQGGVIGLRPEPKQVTLDKELSIFP